MKRIRKYTALFLAAGVMALSGCGGVDQSTYDELKNDYDALDEMTAQLQEDCENYSAQYDELKEQNEELQAQYDEMQAQYDALLAEKNEMEAQYQQYQSEMQQYYDYVMSLQGQTSEQNAYDQQMAELAQSYETGITYQQLVDEPEACMGQKIKFTGQIVDGNTDGGTLNFVLAVDGNDNELIYFSGSQEWLNDNLTVGVTVTVYGTSAGMMEFGSGDADESGAVKGDADESGADESEAGRSSSDSDEDKTDEGSEDEEMVKIPGASFEYIV